MRISLLSILFFVCIQFTVPAQIPQWAKQTNIYEVNLRQYTAEGTIKAFEEHLPRLKKMGVEVLWFMPITPIGIEGRKMNEKELGSYYAVRNYKQVNEEYGTMEDWKSFVRKAHKKGFKVITDWVANHSAPDNPWITSNPEFYAKDSAGKMIAPFDWTDVRKLDYNNRVLRDSMISAMKFWVTETGIDGFRCDVALEVPVDFWKTAITELKKIKPVYMLAEGESPSLHAAGFHTTYNWHMMGAMTELAAGKMTLQQFTAALDKGIKEYPADASRLFFTTNHDENSWNGTEFEKYGEGYKAFAVFTQTIYQSIPLIYSGQEMPNKKRLKFFVKDPIEWTGKYELEPFYKTLHKLRRKNPALSTDASYKKLTTTEDASVFAYIRQSGNNKILVLLNLSPLARSFKITDDITGKLKDVFTDHKVKTVSGNSFSLASWGFGVYEIK